MTTNTPLQIVFIDSRVPDIQDLLSGLQPGEQAFVLDSSSDGMQQIADILAANNLTDLSSISIVSHGEAGQQFINDFSALTGGAQVEAATHIVGSAADGGSWTLDASSNNGVTPAVGGGALLEPAPASTPESTQGSVPATSTANTGASVPF